MSDRELYLEDGLIKYKDDDELDGIKIDGIREISTATYDDVQDWLNNTQSAGYVSGGLITAVSPANGKVNISAVKGFIKITDSELGVTKSFDLAGTTEFALTDGQTNYIYIWYDSGTVKFAVTTTRADIKTTWMFTLGRVYRDGNDVHIIQSGVQLANFVREDHERVIATRGFERASGGGISEKTTRYLESQAGIFFLGNNKATTTGVDTSGAPTFTRHYHSGGNWTSDSKSQIATGDVYQYDNGTDLASISNNKYGIWWVYIHFDSDLHVVVGRGDYTLAEAQAATAPSTPNIVSDFSALAAKIIMEEDSVNFLTVQSAYETFFPLSGVLDHNDLTNVQGGAADDYYHLTNANVGKLNGIATGADVTGDNAPQAHYASHIDGGADEIDITGLVGHQYGKNMIENPTFESFNIDTNLPDGWALLLTPTLAIAADTLFVGRKGNQITITGNGAADEGIQIAGSATNTLKVLPSTKYTISFDCKCTVGDTLDVVVTSYNDAVAGTVHVNAQLTNTDASHKHWSFTSDADANNLAIIFRAAADGDICVVSHIKLEQGAISTPYVHPDRDRTCVRTEATNATPDPIISARKNIHIITALGAAALLSAPTGDIRDGDALILRFLDNSTGRALTYNAIFRGIVAALPATTIIDKTMYLGFLYNLADTKWDMVAYADEP